MQNNGPTPRGLSFVDTSGQHTFIKPVKRINEGQDVTSFLSSRAYADIGFFVMQLNTAICPRVIEVDGQSRTQVWELPNDVILLPKAVQDLQRMLVRIDAIIEEAPPASGPRRFGNVSFRYWYKLLEDRLSGLLEEYLPAEMVSGTGEVTAKDELSSYLLGAFGSAQRLDYGTGHELSFLAFLGGIWKLRGFESKESEAPPAGVTERAIVLNVMEPYLRVVRRLILTYNLEPAGSHGVWGLDDHFFLSYIFGSAQYCPAIKDGMAMPIEGSLPDAPNPSEVANKKIVEVERKRNLYFAAIGFINDVKTGPFWEHSPILYDISGIRAGWGKINKGMIKMFDAEVLSKFPVVQHFPFGSLFSWDKDPDAQPPIATVHTNHQPSSSQPISVEGNTNGAPTARPVAKEGTKAPWTTPSMMSGGKTHPSFQQETRAPWAAANSMPMVAAPWPSPAARAAPPSFAGPGGAMKAPWATEQDTPSSQTTKDYLPDRSSQMKR